MEAKLVLIALLLAGMVVLSTQIPRYRVFGEKLPEPQRRKVYIDDEEVIVLNTLLFNHCGVLL